jgi:outer membrane protein assembly factor BamB
MVAAEIHGVRQYIQMTGRGIVSVDAATGKFLWGYNRIANKIANIPSARVQGNYVFATTGYNTGCALIKVNKEGEVFSAEEVYFLNASDFENHHGGVILAGDHIYGGSGTSKGAPVCIELATGKIAWKAKAPQRGSACVLYADGNVIFRYDRGRVLLVDATPESFKVKSSFDPPVGKGPAWSYPVILNKKLYLRHGDILLCYNVGA